MSWPDFISYNYGSNSTTTTTTYNQQQQQNQPLEYVLEHRDGSMLQRQIYLNDTVENILRAMAHALEESGAASLPPFPKLSNNNNKSVSSTSDNSNHGIHFYDGQQQQQQQADNNGNNNKIDHRFDINTTKGRDLLTFCQTLDRRQVEERRKFRMDASAAALMGRQLFQFQSIDGISLHWSSRSFAILLRSLNKLHEEHSTTKFHVNSFYPLRLVFNYNDHLYNDKTTINHQNNETTRSMSDHPEEEGFPSGNSSSSSSLDLYGGVVYLHPGYTPLQWLDILRQVTPERLDTLQQNRQRLEEAQNKIKSALGIRLKKGFTCSSKDYYYFVLNLAHHLQQQQQQQPTNTNTNTTTKDDEESNRNKFVATTTTAVALESIQVTVEAADACRFRSVITPEGHIRIGCGMNIHTVISSIHRDTERARQKREQERVNQKLSNQQAQIVQTQLGLTRKVYKAGTFRIGHEEFQKCLKRIIDLDPAQKELLASSLGGNALGVAGSGQFCQLGDDGSVIIPHDWNLIGRNNKHDDDVQTASYGAFSSSSI